MDDLLGLDDPLELDDLLGLDTPASIPGAEQYDAKARAQKKKKDARDPGQRQLDGLASVGKTVAGAAEALYGLAHNTSAYLTGIPVTAASIAAKKVPIQDWSKEFFDNVSAMSYVPKTDQGEKLTQDLGEALQPFGLSPYTNMGQMAARAGSRAPKALPAKPQTIQDKLAQVRQEPAAVVPEAPIVAPDLRLEHPLAAETRVREINRKQPSAED